MKIIFLDIDGVMNSHIFYAKRHKKRWLKLSTYRYLISSKVKYVLNGFEHKSISLANYKPNSKHQKFNFLFKRLKKETDPVKWKWLSELCNENNYKICISSVWKNHFKDSSDWNFALIKLGFKDNIFVGITGSRKTLRGDEIKCWIENSPVKIDQYIILDDDNDMLPEQINSFIHIDPYFGLSPNTIYRIKNHLK